MLVILGPTATGKTSLAAHAACALNGEVISADSRQVYRRMDIGTGKDLDDYIVNGIRVPCHLTDVADPGYEYNIYEFQRGFLAAYRDITGRGKLPVLCGGSGMYLEAVLKRYRLAEISPDEEFLNTLQDKDESGLREILCSFTTPHNVTDFEDRPRLIKAILVARAAAHKGHLPVPGSSPNLYDEGFPELPSVIIGVSLPRSVVKARITCRLELRLGQGMIEEVQSMLESGIKPERLLKYGLEYKYVTLFLTGQISREAMFNSLNIAIHQFSKRQMTWFRRMERQGFRINWIDGTLPMDEKVGRIREILGK